MLGFIHNKTKSFLSVIFSLFIISLELILPFFAFGQLENPIKQNSLEDLLQSITALVAKIGGIAAVIFIIYAGFLFITARGSKEQLEKAKKTFTWTVVGTAIILGAYVIAQAIVNFFKGL